MSITLAGPVELQSGQVCLVENVNSGTYMCLAGTKAAAWELSEEWRSSRWTIESTTGGAYTLKNGYNDKYLAPPQGNQGTQLDTLAEPHPWIFKPGSKRGSFMLESGKYPRMNMDLNFGSTSANTKIQLWRTGSERPPQRSWYLKLPAAYKASVENSVERQEKEDEDEKRRKELAETEIRLEERERVLEKGERNLKVEAEKVRDIEKTVKEREFDLSRREDRLRQIERDIGQQTGSPSADTVVLDAGKETSRTKTELPPVQESTEAAESDDAFVRKRVHRNDTWDSFVHSRTAFDLTETGPRTPVRMDEFLHLKRL